MFSSFNIIADNLPTDGILLDLTLLHGVSGSDLFRQIKNHPDLEHIPIVAVGASDPASEIPGAQEIELGGFISKPISLSQFCDQTLQCPKNQPVRDMGYSLRYADRIL